ncbi:LysM peptidoglycan-binding domain-containing protein [Desulfobacula sp.]
MPGQKIMTVLFVLFFLGSAFFSTGFAQNNTAFLPEQDSGFYYTIKKGDTLWDLSEKFYHSQWDWPGLWEMNDDIKNPHRIYPGKKIQIFLKEKTFSKPGTVKNQKINKQSVPVKIEPFFYFSQMDYVGFFKKKAQPSLGSIIKEQDHHLMMSDNDIIYISPSGKGNLVPGKTYQIFTTTRVEKKINNQTFTGVKHLIKAKVKILEHKKAYVKGLITHGYRAVNQGDQIMEYYKRNRVLTLEDTPAPIDARIICSEDNHIMINDNVIAFINAGSDLVKPGQIYTILKKNDIRDNRLWPFKKKSTVPLENLKSGKLIVLHTEKIASTVMILSSKYAIHPGGRVN